MTPPAGPPQVPPAVPAPFSPLAPSELDAEQAALYDKIAGGPRASSPIALVDDAGHLTGPFNPLLYAPAIGDAVQNLGAQLRYASTLTPRERELTTLLVAGHAGCAYELYAHRRLAAAADIAPETIEALAAGQVPPLSDSREQQVTQFCARLLDGAPHPRSSLPPPSRSARRSSSNSSCSSATTNCSPACSTSPVSETPNADNRPVTEAELVQALTDLPGVVAMTAGPDNGAPEVAWGDSFFFYDPDDTDPARKKLPFATIVVKDYPGFDTESNLDRPDVFRLNLAVGRSYFERLFGFPPAAFAEHKSAYDYTVLDEVLPHPVYAKQSWISILVPGPRTQQQLQTLVTHTYERAQGSYKAPRQE